MNEETWAIILGILQKNSPTGSSTVPYWPGVTFTMNDNEGKALLSTPLGSGLAWLLIQHKAEYGLKTAFKASIPASRVRTVGGFHSMLTNLYIRSKYSVAKKLR